MNKLYIVRKYVIASSVSDAIKKEKKTAVDEIYLDKESIPTIPTKEKKVGFKPS